MFCLALSVRVIKSLEAYFHFRLRKKKQPLPNLICCTGFGQFTLLFPYNDKKDHFILQWLHYYDTLSHLLAGLIDALHTFTQIF